MRRGQWPLKQRRTRGTTVQPLGFFVSVCAGGSGDVWGFWARGWRVFQGVGAAGEEGDRRG